MMVPVTVTDWPLVIVEVSGTVFQATYTVRVNVTPPPALKAAPAYDSGR
jgi:hypothetical protein